MKVMRIVRMFSMIAALGVMLAACGESAVTEQPSGTSQNAAENTGAKQNGGDQSDGVQKEQEAGQPVGESGWPRTFEHEFGSMTLPEEPKRIIGLYLEDYLVALGIKPVTQTVIGSFSLQYLQPHIGDLPTLDSSAVSFEAALTAQPDLILLAFPGYASEGKYDKYDKIAPTYVLPADAPDNWRETLRTVGKLTGKEDEAEKVLADYEAKIQDAKVKLAAELGDETVALIRVRSNKELRLYGGPGGYVGNVLYTDLGLNPPSIVKQLAWGDESMKVVSTEILPDLDADRLFITYDEGGKELAQEIMDSSFWKALPAVQSGKVYEVSMDHWMTFGPIAYNQKVDDVLKALVTD